MKFIFHSCLMQLSLGPTFCFSLSWKNICCLLSTYYVNTAKVKTFAFTSLTSTNSTGIHCFHLKFWLMGPDREFFLLYITSMLVSLDLQRPVLIFKPYNCLSQFWICSHNIADNLSLQLQSRHSNKKASLF